jgi:hypothetical protein
MSRSVTGPLPDTADVVIGKLRALAERHDVEFEGDVFKGYANGKGFHITYLIAGADVTVTVTKKPLLVPWSVVEKALDRLF